MGLDQYLYCNSKKVCQTVNDMADEWEGGYQAKNGIAIQWRKANQVHGWFVREVQGGKDDCGIYEVTVSDLVRLHDACKEVLDSTKLVDSDVRNGRTFENGKLVDIVEKGQRLEDPSVAIELLPTESGFFFGGTDYDQWYWWDVQYTERKLALLLDCLVPDERNPWRVHHKDEDDWNVRLEYTSSW